MAILPAHQLIRLLHCCDAQTVELVYYRNGNVEGVDNDIAAHPVKCDIQAHTSIIVSIVSIYFFFLQSCCHTRRNY